MAQRGLRQYTVCGACNIPPRTMTEYLAGRKKIMDYHLSQLSRYFKVAPDALQYDPAREGTSV